MPFFPLRYAALLMLGFCFTIGSVPCALAQTEAKPGATAAGAEQLPPADPPLSSVERDPFRACVAAHAGDPERHRNCDWNGNYSKGH